MVTDVSEAKLLVTLTNSITLPGQIRVVQMSQVFPPFIHQHMRYKEGAFGEIEMVEASYVQKQDWDLEVPYNHIKILSGLSVNRLAHCLSSLFCCHFAPLFHEKYRGGFCFWEVVLFRQTSWLKCF